MEPGWYYAQGDPPGTQRYWDGELWQGAPVPAPPNAGGPSGYNSPAGYGAPAGYAAPPGYGYAQPSYPEVSQATTVLVLGIVSLVVCGLCAPFAWYLGNEEVRAIDAGRRDPANRTSAQVGRILGIIVSLLMLLAILIVFVVVVAGVSSQ